MSASTVRTITGLVLVIHGIGHSMALFPALNISSNETWHHRSWLLSGLMGDTASRVIIVILFGVAIIGFIAAGLGVFGWLVPHDSWRALALISAVLGLVALGIFWNAFASLFPNKIGAVAVNLALLWGLLGTNALSNTLADI
jgi:hypothetical protein